MSQQHQIPIDQLTGSGPGGRIVRRDVEQYMQVAKASILEQSKTSSTSPKPMPSSSRVDQPMQNVKVPLTAKRKVIAQRLTQSKLSAPHYYLKISVQMDAVIQARKELNDKRKTDTRISMNAFLMKLVAHALKSHPIINASWQEDHILLFANQDIALAVAQPDGGLMTPIIRRAADKGILEIDEELSQLVQKARNDTLSIEDYTGAGFTISNLGSFGIDEFTSIINPPGAAILAIGKIQRQAVVTGDSDIQVASMMTMTLSCDHRVIDGMDAARFLAHLKQLIQTPIVALY